MQPRFAVLLALLGSNVSAQQDYDQCTGNTLRIGDGWCHALNNNAACGYDGGDCCHCSCLNDLEYPCGGFGFGCQDPEYVGGEIFNCTGEHTVDGQCSTDTSTQITVNDTASATALADAIICSGGAFNVLWLGHVVVSRMIVVSDGTALTVTGVGLEAEMQAAPGTRLIAAINASLEISNMKITGGNASFGGAIAAVGSYVGLENTSFSGNDALFDGGALYVTSGSIVSCAERTLFDGNHAGRNGGAVSISLSNMTFDGHTSFTINMADASGGALNAYDSHIHWAGDALFLNNLAKYLGGALMIQYSTITWAGDAKFSDNMGGALYVYSSSLSWAGGANFYDNMARVDGGAMIVYDSDLSWVGGANFSDNMAGNEGGALCVYYSTLSWEGDVVFRNNVANESGGAVYVYNSSLFWAGGAHFSDNMAGEDEGVTLSDSAPRSFGGALFVYSSSLFWAGGANFSYNMADDDGGALSVHDSDLSWEGDVVFLNNVAGGRGGAVDVSLSTLSWAGGANFSDNMAGINGGALDVSSSNLSWAGGANFSNNTGNMHGGALYVSFSSKVCFGGEASFLDNNAKGNGGALYITREARALFELDAIFLRNRASGDGGALYIYGKHEEQSTSVDTLSAVQFLGNLCGADGGALVLIANGWLKLPAGRVTFSHNSAQAAGGAVAVKGSLIGPQFRSVSFLSNHAQIGGGVYVTSSGTATAATANRGGDLMENRTTFDRCIFRGNEAEATGGAIDTRAGHDAIVNTCFVGNTARAGGALRLAGISTLDNCTFLENASDDGEGAAVSNAGSITGMDSCSFVNNTFMCKAGEFLDYHDTNSSSRVFALVCKGCDTECDDCTISSRAPACTEVMEHTKSTGGNTTIEGLEIDPGYWRATKTSRKVLACYNTDACKGGVTGVIDYCRAGYEGPYCSTCREGYSPGVGHTCSRCSQSIIIATVFILVVVLLLSYLICRKSTGGRRGLLASWRRQLLSLKMVVIVWQVTTQFASVANVIYPDVYQRFLNGLDFVDFDVSWILSAECIIDLDFHHRLIISTIAPSVALAILAGMYALRRWREGASYHDSQVNASEEARRKYLSLMLLLTFLVYSSVSSTLFQMFACDELDDGKTYLRADYRIDCDSPTHTALQAYAACMMLVYTGGVPALYAILLFKNRQALVDQSARQEGEATKSISNLWELYKPHRYYYELIECARRILLAGVVVFVFPNTAAQVGIALMIAAFFMVFSEMLAPYESVWDAWVNRIGHGLVFGSVYLALLLKIDLSDEREYSERLFESTLIAGHILMFLLATSGIVVVTYQWFNGMGGR